MLSKEGEKTRIWREYERGKDYIQRLNLIAETDEAYRFYEGDQWRGLKTGGERMPVIDVISPIVDYKTAVVTQNLMKIVYSSMNYDDPAFQLQAEEICRQLNAHAARLWENESMDDVCFEVVEDACIARGKYIYFYYVQGKMEKRNGIETEVDPGCIEFDLLDSANIMFSDEQENDIQKQPYILIPMRRRVVDIRAEAKKNGIKPSEIDLILSDEDTDLETGDRAKTEVETGIDQSEGKCLCVLKLWKKNGEVCISKSTRNVVYLEAASTGLKNYPVAGFVWSRVKGTCRGQGAVNKLVSNQININRMAAYRYLNAKMTAFAKPIVDIAVVQNSEKVTEFGTQIEVDSTTGNGGLNNVLNAVGYLQPAATGPDAKNVQDELITHTKDNAGASDVARGNANPDNYRAILAVQEASAAPLNKQTIKLRRFVEDVARIWFDMWVCYFPNGLKVVDAQEVELPSEQDGAEPETAQVEAYTTIPAEVIRNLKPRIKVDVSPTSPFNEFVQQQRIDNMFSTDKIDLRETAELLPDGDPLKAKLERVVGARQEIQQMVTQLQQLQQENSMQAEQIAAQDQALQESGVALHKTALEGLEMSKHSYDKGHMDAQVMTAANMMGGNE